MRNRTRKDILTLLRYTVSGLSLWYYNQAHRSQTLPTQLHGLTDALHSLERKVTS
jgi:hypothetical protein